MAESIYAWIQDLACFFILFSAVMHFLPENSYKKYVQFYMGLLLILVILSPFFQMTGLEEKIHDFAEEFQDSPDEKEEWQKRAQEWEESWKEQGEGTVVKGQEVIP